MSLFNSTNYKDYVLGRYQQMSKETKGQWKALAEALGVKKSMISHVFSGDGHLSPDQAALTAKFLGLSDLESEYFVELVQFGRATSNELKRISQRRLKKIVLEAGQSQKSNHASEEELATLYSNWYYIAIHLLTAIPKYSDIDSISERLGLPKFLVGQALEFLIATGFCVEKNGRIKMGVQQSKLAPDSPYRIRHHLNWRFKAIEKITQGGVLEYNYTAPISIGIREHEQIKKLLQELTQKVKEIVTGCEASEKIAFLNIDFLEL